MPRPGPGKSKEKGAARKAVPSPDDEMQAEATRAAALAVSEWLQASILKPNNDRMVRTAALTGWLGGLGHGHLPGAGVTAYLAGPRES